MSNSFDDLKPIARPTASLPDRIRQWGDRLEDAGADGEVLAAVRDKASEVEELARVKAMREDFSVFVNSFLGDHGDHNGYSHKYAPWVIAALRDINPRHPIIWPLSGFVYTQPIDTSSPDEPQS